jgi:uncharacterized protein involved in exopolysaccharide biosynthesis
LNIYLLDGVLNRKRLLFLLAITTAAAASVLTAAATASVLTAQTTLTVLFFQEVAVAGRVSIAGGNPQ